MNNIENDGIQLFEDQKIRVAWDEQQEEWYFSVVDVVAVLTEQPTYDGARNYWKVLKKRLSDEGSRLVTECNQLKMKSPQGRKTLQDRRCQYRAAQGFDENQKVARRGGNVAGVARKALEAETGRPVVTSQNAESFCQLVTDLMTNAAELPEKVENTGGNDNGK